MSAATDEKDHPIPTLIRETTEMYTNEFTTWAERFQKAENNLGVAAQLVSAGGGYLTLNLTSYYYTEYFAHIDIKCPDREDPSDRVYSLTWVNIFFYMSCLHCLSLCSVSCMYVFVSTNDMLL